MFDAIRQNQSIPNDIYVFALALLDWNIKENTINVGANCVKNIHSHQGEMIIKKLILSLMQRVFRKLILQKTWPRIYSGTYQLMMI